MVNTLLGRHHRLDLLAKLPIGALGVESGGKSKVEVMFPTLNFNIGYKYIF